MRYKLALFSFLLFAFAVSAQNKGPVKWTYDVKKIGEKEYNLVFKAIIGKGVHMYSQHIKGDGPIPTSFSFNKTNGIKLIDSVIEKSKAIKEHDEMFDMELVYFFDVAQFEQHIKVTGEAKNVTGSLEYMACDGTKCYPPETVNFTFQLPQ
jgi:hypothetical protein